MVIFVLGGPGVGKGTQCTNLVRDYGFVHLSAGDLLRAEQKREGSQYGELIKSYIREGKIVPMEVTIALLENAMKEAHGCTRFLVDGFPRKLDQAIKFEEVVCKSKFVIYFECTEATMLKRLLKRSEVCPYVETAHSNLFQTSGRDDDNVESIKKRFRTFVETSMPVVEYFRKQDKVLTVNCEKSIDGVYAELRQAVEVGPRTLLWLMRYRKHCKPCIDSKQSCALLPPEIPSCPAFTISYFVFCQKHVWNAFVDGIYMIAVPAAHLPLIDVRFH